MLLEGLFIPVTTPFHHDGRVNTHKLAANVVRYSRTPAAGLIILGPSGEPTLLNDVETHEALLAAAQAAAPEKVLIAGISRDSVSASLHLANFAAEQSYDAIVIGAPTLFFGMGRSKRRYDELLLFFQAVADRSPLPIVLAYGPTRPPLTDILSAIVTHPNIVGYLYCTTNQTEVRWQLSRNGLEPYPPGTGRQLPLHRIGLTRLVEQTAAIKRQVTVTHTFAAVTSRMKSAAGSDVPDLISARSLAGSGPSIAEVATKREVRTRTKSVGFQIITSNTLQMLEALNTGATGIAPAFAACAPQACYEVFAAWKDQDQPLASEKQQRIVEAARLVESLGPSALKFAADLNGYFGGPPRLPYLPLTREQRSTIEQLMKPIRN